jgi:integrase
VKETHYAAMTDPKTMGALLHAIDGYRGDLPTRCALRLAALTFVRPGELRKAEWAEFDLDGGEWNIAAIRMKTREPHLVPLSRQAVECLRELYPVTGGGRYVFPGVRSASRPLSENTVNAALRRLGYAKTEMTGHGFRAMARTILDEVLGVRPDFIEHQLPTPCATPSGGRTTAPRTCPSGAR